MSNNNYYRGFRRKLTSVSAAAAVALAAGPAWAGQAPLGFQVGAIGGVEIYDLDLQTAGLTVSDLQLQGPTAGIYVSATSTMPDLGGLIGGIEARFQFNDADGSASGGGEQVPVSSRESWGISARLGFTPVAHTLVYARSGWTRTRFSGLDATGRDTVNGFRFGAGAEVAVSPDWSVRGEITRTIYEDFKSNGRSIDIGQNALEIGLARHF
ncbi:MAG: outer membrane protein [Pseudomonadales bacterium]